MKKSLFPLLGLALVAAVHGSPAVVAAERVVTVANLTATTGRSKGEIRDFLEAIGGGIAADQVDAYMDRQRSDLERNLVRERGTGIVRVEALPAAAIRITLDGGAVFRGQEPRLSPHIELQMRKVSALLRQYDKTLVTVTVYYDLAEPTNATPELWQQRANAVNDFLKTKYVQPERLGLVIKGEASPATRRVEILVEPIRA